MVNTQQTATTLASKQASVKQNITILGATGSIGLSTLEVVSLHPDKYSVFALTCHSNVEKLVELAKRFLPQYLVTSNDSNYQTLQQLVLNAGLRCEVLSGKEALQMVAAAKGVDVVMAAIVGASGLLPTFAAVKAGKRVLLANKESLVMSGKLFMDAVEQHNATLLPVDSEHNAIFQCLPDGRYCKDSIRKLLLTGSGGPFLSRKLSTFDAISPAQACKHPNWSMGQKISVDSATMMNKGLEFVEACHLFDVQPDDIEVVIHPQSIIHSMVQYVDGSVVAQLGSPDMRTPIAHSLAWPERVESGVESLDFTALSSLTFEAPDFNRFPCLALAIECAKAGQSATTCLNAANELAVEAFLQGQCRYTDIVNLCEQTVAKGSNHKVTSLEDILAIDTQARELTRQQLENLN